MRSSISKYFPPVVVVFFAAVGSGIQYQVRRVEIRPESAAGGISIVQSAQ